jgi:DNA-directed RNA polymerase subunit beta
VADRISFSKIKSAIEAPDLLAVQLESFEDFLQANVPPDKRENKGLQSVFLLNFPVLDQRENYKLDFIEYYVEKPRYTIQECLERGLTYAVPLKARMRLSIRDLDTQEFVQSVEQDVYLGNLPYMTPKGSFIINGAERAIVSQLHRSPGVVFSETLHPNGTMIYTGRVIPFKGSWVEFATDISNMMYVYIDRKKKFPATTLLRAIGYSSDEQILELFDLFEEVDLNKDNIKEYFGRKLASDLIDFTTGEIFATKDTEFTEEILQRAKKTGNKKVKFIKQIDSVDGHLILNTLANDIAHSEEEALEAIYKQLRATDAPDLETARGLIEKLFFNPKRYDLGEVGRHRMNVKMGLNIPEDITILTKDDIIAIIKYLIELKNQNVPVDDIDHLGNRRVRTVGEQLTQQFNTALARLARTIREKMNIQETDNFGPQDLVNARIISSVINSFFGTNQLSQFLDQTNPLAEITHKRRLSALGPGGLTRERAGFEVRDVHYTHYGRLCPIETPEGPNIGLISSLCIYSRINKYGFIETPYRKVKDGKVTNEIEYLTAEKEDEVAIAQASTKLNEQGKFVGERIISRLRGDFPEATPDQIKYMDVAPNQIVSPAASLIPFLEHDDANRALMGSNMQRQAVPLLKTESPIVGTGMEGKVARDSRALILAEGDGVVIECDSNHITVEYDMTETERLTSFVDRKIKTYELTKFYRTNQDTCLNQKPLVVEGQRVKKGDVLADGHATENGELALGKNILVAYMPWRGYNFEDAIILSERLVKEDVYTSIHIEEFELQVRETKRGEEELTREIPNVSEEATKDLDEYGIVRVGTEVKEGDILIGKITPKGETDPTPEERLLRAIFGDKAGDVKDASLRAPAGMKGVVVATKLFTRRRRDAEGRKEDKRIIEQLEKQHDEDIEKLRNKLIDRLVEIFDGVESVGIKFKDGSSAIRSGTVLRRSIFEALGEKIDELDVESDWTENSKKNNLVRKLYENYFIQKQDIDDNLKREKNKIQAGDDLPPGILQLAKVYVAKKRKIMVGDKMAGRHGNKGVVAKIVPVEDMPFLPDGTPVDIILNPLGVPSRMNVGQLLECALGWAGYKLGVKFATPIFDGASWEEIQEYLKKAGLNPSGKTVLYDGRTGEKFDKEVTVGVAYIMKLSHLVEDKIHARSIGPYSLITQQPLGGKAQFGGQRFGEMEVWALEAYGAAHTLQEMLTVKSDDVTGRAKVYEAIVKGDNFPEANVPESFNVLVRELQGLCLEVNVEYE